SLTRALKQLEQGIAPEQALNELARTLTNRLLHEPSRQLRQSGFDEEGHLLNAARQLFNLKDPK
ncbi:hypothetical protein LCGC14_1950870, partial [marine sediment metagenome]